MAAFARKNYPAALATVQALLADPRFLDETNQAFLKRQQELCHRALSGKPLTGASSVSSAPAPRRRIALSDCGPRALLLAAETLQVPQAAEANALPNLRKAAGTTRSGTNLQGLVHAAKTLGLKAEGVQMDGDALANLQPPAIAWVDGSHYVAVLEVTGDARTGTVTIHDPNEPEKEEIPLRKLLSRSGGVFVTLRRL